MTHVRCIKKTGTFQLEKLYKVKTMTKSGRVDLQMVPYLSSHPILFVDSDGKPDGGKDWQHFQPVAQTQ